MSQLSLLRVVIAREFYTRVRSRAFWIAMTFLNLAILAAVIVPTLGGDTEETLTIGVVAQTSSALQESLESVHMEQLSTDPDSSQYDIVKFVEFSTLDLAKEAVGSGEVDFTFASNQLVILKGGSVTASTYVPNVVWTAAQVLQLQSSSAATGMSVEELVALSSPDLEIELLEGDEVEGSKLATAYAGMMATYMAIMIFGSWTLAGVLEEKTSKVVETIVSTVRPRILLAGKVIGIGAIALCQIGVAATVGIVGVNITGALDGVGGLPTSSLLMLGLWFVVGFIFYNTLFAATGSLVSRIEDAQAASMPITVVSMLAMGISFAVLDNPDGLAAQVGTYVPLLSPFVVPIRFAQDAISWPEVVLGLAVAVAFGVASIACAGRIYEGALLRSGSRVKLRDAWRGDS